MEKANIKKEYKKNKQNFFSFDFVRDMKWYEWLIILAMTIAELFVAIFDETDVASAIFNYSITLAGFLYLVCASHCSFWIFVLGFYQPIAYGFVCLNAQVYGEMIINFAYFAPMQIVGIILWVRNARKINSDVDTPHIEKIEVRSLKPRQYLYLVPIVVVIFVVLYFVLSQLNGQRLPYLDALISVGYTLGTLLLTLRYIENWYVYLVVNALSCVLWILLAVQGNGDAWYIFILDIAYLLYTIIGLIQWRKYAKRNKQSDNNGNDDIIENKLNKE